MQDSAFSKRILRLLRKGGGKSSSIPKQRPEQGRERGEERGKENDGKLPKVLRKNFPNCKKLLAYMGTTRLRDLQLVMPGVIRAAA